MITRVDSTLRAEAAAYSFRFGCESCMAFDPERATCAYGYPTAPHRAIALDRVDSLAFCKAFELG